jgi:hypothetical protein
MQYLIEVYDSEGTLLYCQSFKFGSSTQAEFFATSIANQYPAYMQPCGWAVILEG